MELLEIGRQAREVSRLLGKLGKAEKDMGLKSAANALLEGEAAILEANKIDMENGRSRGMNQGLLDRLELNHNRIQAMAEGLFQIAEMCIRDRSKMVAARLAREQYRNSLRILKLALIYATVVGGLGAAVLWFGAETFALALKKPFCKYALETLAPTIWIMAYLGVLRGYFQGKGTMVPTAPVSYTHLTGDFFGSIEKILFIS